jgi:uncharacterized protein YutE (UPF0331/DUF86 family)
MTATTAESRVLALLRRRYEDEGFTFIEYPNSVDLPPFLEGYRPDAVALGDKKSIAIEVKLRRTPDVEKQLRALSERFEGHTDWEFRVVYGDELEVESYSVPTTQQIEAHLSEAESLLAGNHSRAAFVLSWAAIEALARAVNQAPRVANSRQAIESLEHMGRLSFREAAELRKLLPLRSKIVHGDFGARISAEQVRRVLRAARSALHVT